MGRTAQYLIAIYALEHAEGTPLPTGRIARVLDRSPAATTEMAQRLAGDELIEYEPYSGVELTESGEDQAASLFDIHETLCRFFRDVLMLDDYTQEAFSLAGVVSPEIGHRLETTVLPPDNTPPEPIALLPAHNQSTPAGEKEQTEIS